MTLKALSFTLSAALIAFVLSVFSPTASGQSLFVASVGDGRLHQFTLGGAPLSTSDVGVNALTDVAVSGDSLFATSVSGYVAEYTMANSLINSTLFVPSLEDRNPYGIAADASNLYVTTFGPSGAGDGAVGEYTSAGSVVNASLITGLTGPIGIAIDGDDLFVSSYALGTISEYTTSGTLINASLISGLNGPYYMAISGGNLYVTESGNGTVGEFTTSGATINPSLISGLQYPTGIAVFGNDLFVGSYDLGTIGEYTTTGAVVNAALISGLDRPYGMVVVAPEPSTLSLVVAGFGLAVLFGASCRCRRTRRISETFPQGS
jgi:hypothetical protein